MLQYPDFYRSETVGSSFCDVQALEYDRAGLAENVERDDSQRERQTDGEEMMVCDIWCRLVGRGGVYVCYFSYLAICIGKKTG